MLDWGWCVWVRSWCVSFGSAFETGGVWIRDFHVWYGMRCQARNGLLMPKVEKAECVRKLLFFWQLCQLTTCVLKTDGVFAYPGEHALWMAYWWCVQKLFKLASVSLLVTGFYWHITMTTPMPGHCPKSIRFHEKPIEFLYKKWQDIELPNAAILCTKMYDWFWKIRFQFRWLFGKHNFGSDIHSVVVFFNKGCGVPTHNASPSQ